MRSSSCNSSSPSVSSQDIPASIIVVGVRRRALDAEVVDSIRNLVLPILIAVDRDGVVVLLDGKSTIIIIGIGDDVQACDTREDSGSVMIHNKESAENDDLVIMLVGSRQWILLSAPDGLVVALMEVLCCCPAVFVFFVLLLVPMMGGAGCALFGTWDRQRLGRIRERNNNTFRS
jgi:hypothetical protein